ncbi:MAG: DUF1697 domain-containing protein [Bacteroidota bacterium]
MQTFIALLRGINVSGKNLIKMAPLAEALTRAGLLNIRTYIQSGNIVFESDTEDKAVPGQLIAEKIRKEFGLSVPVRVLKQTDLRRIRDDNPFIGLHGLPEDKLHLTLLAGAPDPALVQRIAEGEYLPDEYTIKGEAIYLHCPDGYGRTKLTNTFFENRLKVSATTRNWATIVKLCSM